MRGISRLVAAPMQAAQTPRRSKSYQFVILAVIFAVIAIPLYRLSYNILFIGYNLFGEMRLATVFFAVVTRILVYPVRILSVYTRRLEEKADQDYTRVADIKDPVARKTEEKNSLERHRHVLLFLIFQMAVYLLVAIISARMFAQAFTPQGTGELLYPFVAEPEFPLQTTDWIPLVGEVDLTKINNRLNFMSAAGAGLVGLFEVIVQGKTKRRELLMLLVGYPAGAYFLTSQVPSGFEFSLLVFEILTIAVIFVEKGLMSLWRRLTAFKEDAPQA
jgi:hypothetical protein